MRPALLVTLSLLLAAAVSGASARVHVQSSPGDVGLLPDQETEGDGPVNYDGHQVLKVFIANNNTVDILRSYDGKPGVDFWTEPSGLAPTVDVMVSPDVRRELTDQLTSSGATYTVNIDDVQGAIMRESPPMSDTERELLVGRRGHPLTWTAYHRLDDHHQYLDYIAQNYEGLCSKFSIGTSTEGRDLKGIKCGFGKKEIWIDGGIHAREWVSPAVVSCLAREFSENSYKSRDILKNFTIHIIPVLNPDGYEFSRSSPGNRLWRKTRSRNPGSKCIGTDPNRNFGVHWGESGSSTKPCKATYRGARPFSEPETRAVRDFLFSHKRTMKMYISFHSYSQMLFVPFAYSKARPTDYDELLRVARVGEEAIRGTFNKAFDVGQASELLYSASGGSDDWAKAVAGIKYSYTFELRDTGRHGFMLPADQIEDSCTETVAGVQAMIRASRS